MGALIQTKGTQRLAHLFNNRFDAGLYRPYSRRSEIPLVLTLKTAFANSF